MQDGSQLRVEAPHKGQNPFRRLPGFAGENLDFHERGLVTPDQVERPRRGVEFVQSRQDGTDERVRDEPAVAQEGRKLDFEQVDRFVPRRARRTTCEKSVQAPRVEHRSAEDQEERLQVDLYGGTILSKTQRLRAFC